MLKLSNKLLSPIEEHEEIEFDFSWLSMEGHEDVVVDIDDYELQSSKLSLLNDVIDQKQISLESMVLDNVDVLIDAGFTLEDLGELESDLTMEGFLERITTGIKNVTGRLKQWRTHVGKDIDDLSAFIQSTVSDIPKEMKGKKDPSTSAIKYVHGNVLHVNGSMEAGSILKELPTTLATTREALTIGSQLFDTILDHVSEYNVKLKEKDDVKLKAIKKEFLAKSNDFITEYLASVNTTSRNKMLGGRVIGTTGTHYKTKLNGSSKSVDVLAVENKTKTGSYKAAGVIKTPTPAEIVELSEAILEFVTLAVPQWNVLSDNGERAEAFAVKGILVDVQEKISASTKINEGLFKLAVNMFTDHSFERWIEIGLWNTYTVLRYQMEMLYALAVYVDAAADAYRTK